MEYKSVTSLEDYIEYLCLVKGEDVKTDFKTTIKEVLKDLNDGRMINIQIGVAGKEPICIEGSYISPDEKMKYKYEHDRIYVNMEMFMK